MLKGAQISLGDVNEDYKAFVDKFKPKKTTDDCYTPANIYEAIKDWACKEYEIDPETIIRPFWPGGDYEREHYPEGCVVLDNPPFSILSQIVDMYTANGIRFFLFAPCLTNFASGKTKCSHIITGEAITYENGARVDTSFLTNLDTCFARTAPELTRRIKEEDKKNRNLDTKELPKYAYPDEVLTAAMLRYMAVHGTDFRVRFDQVYFVRELAAQAEVGKAIFGGGVLLSRKAAAEKAAAEKEATERAAEEKADVTRWELSQGEIEIIDRLSNGGQ